MKHTRLYGFLNASRAAASFEWSWSNLNAYSIVPWYFLILFKLHMTSSTLLFREINIKKEKRDDLTTLHIICTESVTFKTYNSKLNEISTKLLLNFHNAHVVSFVLLSLMQHATQGPSHVTIPYISIVNLLLDLY